MAGAL
jgi:hypothetical protein